jgi:SnoaL-like domain
MADVVTAMDENLEEMLNRSAISDCIVRYARGVDRLDEELFLSAYHPDAIECHGSFIGSPTELKEYLWSRQKDRAITQHHITNQSFDIDGDVAHVETYFFSPCVWRGRSEMTTVGGRYIDRFEKRRGEWRIAFRVLVREWHIATQRLIVEPPSDMGRRDKNDPSYLRPLNSSWSPNQGC